MAQPVALQNQAIDNDDKIASALIPKSGAATKVVFADGSTFLRTRTGRRATLTGFGNDVDPGGQTFLAFTIYVNGVPLQPPYYNFTQALGQTFNPLSLILTVPVSLPQGALVEVVVVNSDTTADYNAFVRLQVEYAPLN